MSKQFLVKPGYYLISYKYQSGNVFGSSGTGCRSFTVDTPIDPNEFVHTVTKDLERNNEDVAIMAVSKLA